MPNRIIHERATTSETLAALDDGTERHFWRLIVQADDYGYLDARQEVIRARAYPMMLNKVSEEESERRTQALTSVDLLHLFATDGKRYGHFPTWEKYQRVRAKISRFPQVTSCDINCRQSPSHVGLLSESRILNPESRIQNPEEPPKSPAVRGTRKVKGKRITEITPEFIEEMVISFKERLGGDERTRQIILEATGHKNVERWADKQVYLSGWLRREAEKVVRNGQNPQGSRRVEAHPPGYWDGKDKW